MKKFLVFLGAFLSLGVAGAITAPQTYAATSSPVYRLYNHNTGEHFYTLSQAEKNNLQNVGWSYEGIGWQAAKQGKPVYRVYNPQAAGGDHYYTLSKYEAQTLVNKGWRWDNGGKAAFYSGGKVNLYVAYNPHAQSGSHNYTTNSFEQNSLLKGGWKYGAVAWKVQGGGSSASGSNSSNGNYTTSGGWTIAANGYCFVSDSNLYYSKVKNPKNYRYMTRAQANSKGYHLAPKGNGYAQP
ncbi:glycoside hydrolase, family 25 [Lactococcus taiwanensis]|jgi:hypothetical protein|uniref:glycoside hydrolase, family 25 n=1 Tax=Lactococcus taiwanensis TaxID=1151742 RepID=UPI0007B1B1E2|nr:glycoside hydrolase, family 25 [Lactococcus taiwanensis]KZK37682.1 Cell wall surface anchor family protein [Lactococcus cremoris]